jgi:tRNA(Leu) C34 or U34 (ribose-2'-O)-methylase TrmL
VRLRDPARVLTLPMVAGRSLNLSQVAAVTVFEAVSQLAPR